MPHRDPETGEFVASSASDIRHSKTAWENDEHSWFSLDLRMPDPNGNVGTNAEIDMDSALTVEPQSGLEFNELAEMVAVGILGGHIRLDAPSDLTVSQSMEARYEISTDPVMKTGFQSNVEVLDDPFVNRGTTTGDVTAWGQDEIVEDDSEILLVGDAVLNNHVDDTAGNAIGPSVASFDTQIRPLHGGGPVLEDDDELHLHLSLRWQNAETNIDYGVSLAGTADWSIVETDAPR